MAFKKGDKLQATLNVIDNVTGDAMKANPELRLLLALGGITEAPMTCKAGDLCTFQGTREEDGLVQAMLTFAPGERHGTPTPNPANELGIFHVAVGDLATHFIVLKD